MDSAVEKSITDYIRKAYNRGFTKKQIRDKLLSSGFKAKDVDVLLEKAVHPLMKFYIALGVILAVIVISVIIFWNRGESVCNDQDCMLDALRSCDPATYVFDIDGTEITAVSKECTLIKTVTGLASGEPEEIEVLFLDRSMVCTYDRDDPDPSYLYTISGGLDSCEGELKDAIMDVREAQALLE